MMETLAPLCAGGALTCGIIGIVSINAEIRKAQENPDDDFYLANVSPMLLIVLPYFRFVGKIINLIFRFFKSLPGAGQYPWSLYQKLTVVTDLKILIAGKKNVLISDEIFGMMIVLGGAGGLFGGFAYKILGSIAFPIVFVSVGFGLPYLWLSEAAKYRQKVITRELPFAMDLMSLTVEAGLDFTVALQRIINEMGRGILSDEYSEMLRQIQLGTPRKEALRDLANRCQVVSLTSCCSAIIQADEVGANLAPILKILSGTLREQRSTRAEELAGKAPVKMLAPLILCIFPCVFIIIFAPIFIKTVIGGPSM
jgi:tight adherence protein C